MNYASNLPRWPSSWMPSWSVFDLAGREKSITELEIEAAAPGFWDDPTVAQRKMQQSVELWSGLQSQVTYLLELTELAIETDDDGLLDELGSIPVGGRIVR